MYILCNCRFEVVSLILLIMYNSNLVSVLFRFRHHYMPVRSLIFFYTTKKRVNIYIVSLVCMVEETQLLRPHQDDNVYPPIIKVYIVYFP